MPSPVREAHHRYESSKFLTVPLSVSGRDVVEKKTPSSENASSNERTFTPATHAPPPIAHDPLPPLRQWLSSLRVSEGTFGLSLNIDYWAPEHALHIGERSAAMLPREQVVHIAQTVATAVDKQGELAIGDAELIRFRYELPKEEPNWIEFVGNLHGFGYLDRPQYKSYAEFVESYDQIGLEYALKELAEYLSGYRSGNDLPDTFTKKSALWLTGWRRLNADDMRVVGKSFEKRPYEWYSWDAQSKQIRRKVEQSKVVAAKLISEFKKLSGPNLDDVVQAVFQDPEIGAAFSRRAEEYRPKGVKRSASEERRLIAEVFQLSSKQFKAWLEEKDEVGTNKSLMKKVFSKWLAYHHGEELNAEAAQEFNEVVKTGMDRLRVRFECPKCGEHARFDYWSTKGLFQFVHADKEKHSRSRKVPHLKLVPAADS